MKASGGERTLLKAVRSRIPSRETGSLLRLSSDCAVGSSWALKAGEIWSALVPTATAWAASLETGAKTWKPGRSSLKKTAVLARKGRILGRVSIATSSVSGAFEIVSWMKGRETSARARKVVSRSTKSWPWTSATGAASAAVAERAELADRGVEADTAPGESVAELEEVGLDRGPGGLVEHIEDLVDLDRFGPRRGKRDRLPRSEALGGVAALDFQVLEPEGRARPHDHRRVLGQGIEILVQLHVDLGADRARFLVLDRLDLLDLADPGAADPDLVARHQGGGVRELGGELVGGHEGQPLVRLIGEEDRDHDDQHGDRADQGRAGGEGANPPAPHVPLPRR